MFLKFERSMSDYTSGSNDASIINTTQRQYFEIDIKICKAFNIIKSLMDNDIIKEDISSKKFIDMFEIISKEI